MNTIRIAIAQLNFTVGAVFDNAAKIIDAIQKARDEQHAHIIVFPELAITGYPLEDLLHRPRLYELTDQALEKIRQATTGIDVIMGYPQKTEHGNFNSATWIRDRKDITTYHKQKLPNYGVFDELRYFQSGKTPSIVEHNGIKFALAICEDVWFAEPVEAAKMAGAQCIIALNASPYSINKSDVRQTIIAKHSKQFELPIVYANLVGGQDELVFDGQSFVMNAEGKVCAKATALKEELLIVELNQNGEPIPQNLKDSIAEPEMIYSALTLGVHDYVKKNHFPGAIIGLSGGIDSASTLAIAVDALGAENVTAVFMPSQYTRDISREDARKQAEILGVEFHEMPIDTVFQNFLNELNPLFKHQQTDVTEENIQARIRGIFLMALSNKLGKLVLSTGNKSEMAVGYSTLYGDMVGGFCVLKDVFKTKVYQLAKYRNSISPAIPERVIERAPSAELAPDQLDQDSLPPYDELDKILTLFIEHDCDAETIIQKGFDAKIVTKVIKLVLRNEYKRRQAPLGIRITEKAFGRDRRYPITSGY